MMKTEILLQATPGQEHIVQVCALTQTGNRNQIRQDKITSALELNRTEPFMTITQLIPEALHQCWPTIN